MDTVFFIFEIIGTVAFSLSGVLEAVKHRMDLFGVTIMGLVTAVGGGVIRDLVIGSVPPVAFVRPVYAIIAISVALALFIFLYFWKSEQKDGIYPVIESWLLFATDTIGLGAFTVTGIATALSHNMDGIALLLFVGVITGTGGGILRDLFCCTIPAIFKKHIYALASVFGAALMIVFRNRIPLHYAMIVGFSGVVLIRILARVLRWDLPVIGNSKNENT